MCAIPCISFYIFHSLCVPLFYVCPIPHNPFPVSHSMWVWLTLCVCYLRVSHPMFPTQDICPLCVPPRVSHFMYDSLRVYLSFMYVPSRVSHSVSMSPMWVPSRVSHFVYSTPCMTHSVGVCLRCISHPVYPFSCIPLHVWPTPCMFVPYMYLIPCPTPYVCPLCVFFHSVYPISCISLFVWPTPSVIHSVCVPLRVCPTPYVSHSVCIPLHVFPTTCVSDSVCPTPCMFHSLCLLIHSYLPFLCLSLHVSIPLHSPLHVFIRLYMPLIVRPTHVLLMCPIPSIFPYPSLPLPISHSLCLLLPIHFREVSCVFLTSCKVMYYAPPSLSAVRHQLLRAAGI